MRLARPPNGGHHENSAAVSVRNKRYLIPIGGPGGIPIEARVAYQDFLTLWKQADTDVPS